MGSFVAMPTRLYELQHSPRRFSENDVICWNRESLICFRWLIFEFPVIQPNNFKPDFLG